MRIEEKERIFRWYARLTTKEKEERGIRNTNFNKIKLAFFEELSRLGIE